MAIGASQGEDEAAREPPSSEGTLNWYGMLHLNNKIRVHVVAMHWICLVNA